MATKLYFYMHQNALSFCSLTYLFINCKELILIKILSLWQDIHTLFVIVGFDMSRLVIDLW